MKKHTTEEKKPSDATAPEQELPCVDSPPIAETITPEERISQLEEQLAAKTAECRENWDKFLRERADLENYRKRANREKEELLNYGTKSLIEEILPVVDNLERALSHASENGLTGLMEGVQMTHSMLITALKKFGVAPIETTGAVFDPSFHQAMTQIPTDQQPPNTVVDEFQRGYMLKDRLLRPAMVSVASAPK
jgi:molecular chaperone GrpE